MHSMLCDLLDLVLNLYHFTRTCPFYLSRESQSEADIVLLPYQYLVDATARKLMNIDLYNSIIIFDEAHNLVGSRLNSRNAKVYS